MTFVVIAVFSLAISFTFAVFAPSIGVLLAPL